MCSWPEWICDLKAEHWISIVNVITDVAFAGWVIAILQNRLSNQRVLKDHFISEVKDLRDEFDKYIKDLEAGLITPKSVKSWFKSMNIRADGIVDVTGTKYRLKKSDFKLYTIDLRELITNCAEYNRNYINDTPIILEASTKTNLVRFQQTSSKVFNNIIVKINDK